MTKPVILIPRPTSASTDALVKELQAMAMEVIAEPLIKILPIPPEEVKLRSKEELYNYDWLVAVSNKAIKFWLESIANHKEDLGFSKNNEKDLPLSGLPPIWVPGNNTAECVTKQGGKPLLPAKGTGSPAIYQGMLQHFAADTSELNKQKILTICGVGGGKELDRLLDNDTDKEIVYHTQATNTTADSKLGQQVMSHGRVDYVWLTSETMLKAFGEIIKSKGNYPLIYMTAKIIVGSQRLKLLAQELNTGQIDLKIVGLESPTNESLLKYLATKS